MGVLFGCKQEEPAWEPPDVLINEIVASNRTGLQDATGAYPDWVELYNRGEATANLSAFTFTDDPTVPQKWSFPAAVEIQAGDYLIIFADGDQTTADELHTPFRLSASGETVQLIGPSSEDLPIIDSVEFGPQTTDVSWARMPDGGEFEADDTPTPGAANE